LAWSEGRRPSGAGLRTSDEPGELSQWLSHDDSIINIVIRIIIILIIVHHHSNVMLRPMSAILDYQSAWSYAYVSNSNGHVHRAP